MPAKRSVDQFVNILTGTVTESVAGTLAFSNRIETGYQLADKIGMIIHHIDYYQTQASKLLMLDSADYLNMGFCTSNQISSVDPTGATIVDYVRLGLQAYGVAASGWIRQDYPTLSRDFTSLPGGGLLVAPTPLYGFIQGVSMASVSAYTYRLYYTVITMSESAYRELWESWNMLRI